VAAYYVVSEALTNAAKHAEASPVRDDGVCGADPARGTGLVGLRDRVEAAGGHIEVDSPPGGGTSWDLLHVTAAHGRSFRLAPQRVQRLPEHAGPRVPVHHAAAKSWVHGVATSRRPGRSSSWSTGAVRLGGTQPGGSRREDCAFA
jgi:hypothetical protein